jgi:hypothetical protein
MGARVENNEENVKWQLNMLFRPINVLYKKVSWTAYFRTGIVRKSLHV